MKDHVHTGGMCQWCESQPRPGHDPEKPTTGSWAGDARALLEMGCRDIGAATVRGLLGEFDALRATHAFADGLRREGATPVRPASVRAVDVEERTVRLRFDCPEVAMGWWTKRLGQDVHVDASDCAAPERAPRTDERDLVMFEAGQEHAAAELAALRKVAEHARRFVIALDAHGARDWGTFEAEGLGSVTWEQEQLVTAVYAWDAARSTPCASNLSQAEPLVKDAGSNLNSETSGGEGMGLAHASDSEARPPMTTSRPVGPTEAGTFQVNACRHEPNVYPWPIYVWANGPDKGLCCECNPRTKENESGSMGERASGFDDDSSASVRSDVVRNSSHGVDERAQVSATDSSGADEDRAWKWLNDRDSNQMHEYSLELAALLAEVRAEEREACARIAESLTVHSDGERALRYDIAVHIRRTAKAPTGER